MKKKKVKDSWRYDYVGEESWKIEKSLYYSPEDDYIEMLDNRSLECLSDAGIDTESLHEALDQINPRYKKIIWDYHFEGKSFGRIGKEAGYTKQYAFQEYTKAITLLRKLLK